MKPIHRTQPDEFLALMAWARYLYWCDLHHRHFEAWLVDPHDMGSAADKWHFLALVSQWYASLWVVVEGWNKNSYLDDPVIDSLLNTSDKYCDLLRRYRHGVYHYQPSLIEPRLLDFLREAKRTVPWVEALHHEFLRFFDETLSTIPGKGNQKELRDSVLDLIGWLPTDTAAALQRDVDQVCDQARSLVEQSGDSSTPEARDLLANAARSRVMARDHAGKYRAWEERLIASVTK